MAAYGRMAYAAFRGKRDETVPRSGSLCCERLNNPAFRRRFDGRCVQTRPPGCRACADADGDVEESPAGSGTIAVDLEPGDVFGVGGDRL